MGGHKMKIKVFLGILLISLLFISGCGNGGENLEDSTGNVVIDTPEETNKVVCNEPYILVGTSCCLDQNDNSICDNDESQSSPTGEPILSQSNTIEECHIGGRFECESYIINNDKITLKLKSKNIDYQAPKSIYLPSIGLEGCELNLDPSFDNALEYQESRIFEIPCNINKDSVDTKLIIEFISYKLTTNAYGFDVENEEGKFYIHDRSSEGYLWGMVR